MQVIVWQIIDSVFYLKVTLFHEKFIKKCLVIKKVLYTFENNKQVILKES